MEGNSTQIDELRLDITVEDKTSGDSSDKRVRKLATAISALNTAINNSNIDFLKNKFAEITTAIQPFLTSLNTSSQALIALSNVVLNKTTSMKKLNNIIYQIDNPLYNSTI